MPLALEALLPFLLLTGGALGGALAPLRRWAGTIAALATAGAGVAVLALLLRLAPAERVDIPYLRAFPAMDLAIRVDALSLAFALTLLAASLVLILARLLESDDRRRPWSAWLLTTAAALGVLLSGGLVLIYAFLRLCTLAWSGALDEMAPRGRGPRLAEQLADLGLLLAAGLAAAGTGTTALSGLPSDALGAGTFLLALLPVAVRIAGVATQAERPRAPVLFHPAIAQASVAGYLLLRLLALAGGRPPGRGLQVLLFGAGLALVIVMSLDAWRAPSPGLARLRLGAAQAGMAISLCALGTPVAAVAGVWAWLGAVVLVALAAIRQAPDSAGARVTALAMTAVPPGFIFTALWLGSVSLIDSHLEAALAPFWLAALLAAAAALRHLLAAPPRLTGGAIRSWSRVPLGAVIPVLAVGAFPATVLPWLVIPASRIVRGIPKGSLSWGPLGIQAGSFGLPSFGVALVALVAAALWLRLARPFVARPPLADRLQAPVFLPRLRPPDLRTWRSLPWLRFALLAYAALVVTAIVRQ